MAESLVPVYQRLVKLEQTSSTNDKIALLKKFLKNKNFLLVVKYALSGDMKYHIKAMPKASKSLVQDGSVSEIFKFLRLLANQAGASNSDKKKLAALASIDSGTYEVVKRIVNKDLKCGVNAKTVNKALSGTVNIVPYMRCSTERKIDNISYPAIIQEKADGMFVNIMINKKGQIKIITRNGKTVHQLRHLKKVILKGRGLPPKKSGKVKLTTHYGILNSTFGKNCLGMVYTGELLVSKMGKIAERKTGNGILNQCIHGTASKYDAQCVILKIWDCLPLKSFYEGYCEVAYNTRVFNAQQFVHAVNDKEIVDMVMTKRVDSYEEAHDFYARIREAGGEGAILKNISSIWKYHTSPDQVKMKNVSEAELVIVGWEPGNEGTKYELCMGAIKCQSAEGTLEVNVGSGFSDDEREADWDLSEGEIVTIEFESVIQDKRNKGKYSLFLPRFKEVRTDRDTPDTIQDILER